MPIQQRVGTKRLRADFRAIVLGVWLSAGPTWGLANTPEAINAPAIDGLTLRETGSGTFELIARQQPLSVIFEALSKATGVTIRSKMMPETPITATCAPGNIKRMLQCLLGTDADFVFTYSPQASGPDGLSEVRVLSSTFQGDRSAKPLGFLVTGTPPAPKPRSDSSLQETLQSLLDMTQAKNPERRARGLAKLRAFDSIDESTLRTSLETGWHDKSGTVRAEALAGLLQLPGENQADLLQAAMADRSADVRLVAVDVMRTSDETNQALLQKALKDADQSVRVLAGLKLKEK